jgi:hypothetical protein
MVFTRLWENAIDPWLVARLAVVRLEECGIKPCPFAVDREALLAPATCDEAPRIKVDLETAPLDRYADAPGRLATDTP